MTFPREHRYKILSAFLALIVMANAFGVTESVIDTMTPMSIEQPPSV